MIVFVDLDGTLCDTRHRAHMLERKPRDWEAYSKACTGDDVIEEVGEVVRALAMTHNRVVFVTGRHECARHETQEWLQEHGFHSTNLVMRAHGDLRPNPEVKVDLVCGWLERMRYDATEPLLAIDDHPGVANAFAEVDIPTLIVNHDATDNAVAAEVASRINAAGPVLPGPIAEALATARDTFVRKNADYAADDAWRSNFDSIAGQMGFDAVVAADTLIAVKQARLQALKANGRDPQNESVVDTYLDRMVYSIIAFALLLDDNERESA